MNKKLFGRTALRQVGSAFVTLALLGNLTPAFAVADVIASDVPEFAEGQADNTLGSMAVQGDSQNEPVATPQANCVEAPASLDGVDCPASVKSADTSDALRAQAVEEEPLAAQDQGSDTLDPKNLANGTYNVGISLRKLGDLSSASMAASAFDGTGTLTVKNGAYSISLPLGSVQVGSITGYIDRLAYYESYSVSGNALSVSGSSTVVFASSGEGDSGPANVPVGDTGKESGYLALELWSSAMGATSQDAALKIDWATLSLVSSNVDDGAFATSGDTSAPAPAEEAAIPAHEEQAEKFGGIYEVGHVYKVPISFKKAGSSEASMAGQYFGSYAYVRPLSNGNFDVRFSTNRPDYILSLSHNGSPASVTSESSASREYLIYMDQTTDEAVAGLSVSVKPMMDLGAGAQDVDMHIYFGSAADLGNDTGQVASSASASGTGDKSGQLMTMWTTFAACSAAIAVVVALQRRRIQED